MDISAALLDPDTPVHPPDGMSVEECLTVRKQLAEQQRLDGIAEAHARRAGRYPSRVELFKEEKAAHRIAAAEDRREGRTDPAW